MTKGRRQLCSPKSIRCYGLRRESLVDFVTVMLNDQLRNPVKLCSQLQLEVTWSQILHLKVLAYKEALFRGHV